MHDELHAQVSEQLGLDVAVRDVARLQAVRCRAELPDSVEGHRAKLTRLHCLNVRAREQANAVVPQ
eukprot:4420259-Pyramimonas_sp.AAC.1